MIQRHENALDAIREAEYMAVHHGEPYSIADISDGRFVVARREAAMKVGASIVETVHPITYKSRRG